MICTYILSIKCEKIVVTMMKKSTEVLSVKSEPGNGVSQVYGDFRKELWSNSNEKRLL